MTSSSLKPLACDSAPRLPDGLGWLCVCRRQKYGRTLSAFVYLQLCSVVHQVGGAGCAMQEARPKQEMEQAACKVRDVVGKMQSTCEYAYSSPRWSRRAERATCVQEAKSKRDAERAAREAERAAKDAAVKATAQDAADALAAKAGDDAKAKSDDKADVKAEPSAKAEQANGQVRRGQWPDVRGRLQNCFL